MFLFLKNKKGLARSIAHRSTAEGSMTEGFTLIELLVVVAIIGILASVVLASLNTARAKGRDAKRVSEINQLQTALELYYNDNDHYPVFCGGSSYASIPSPGWSTLLSSSYIGSMPIDPSNAVGQYGYYYCIQYKPNGKCSYTNTPGVNTNYMLTTRLENRSATSNSCPSDFSGWDSSSLNYIVGVGQ